MAKNVNAVEQPLEQDSGGPLSCRTGHVRFEVDDRKKKLGAGGWGPSSPSMGVPLWGEALRAVRVPHCSCAARDTWSCRHSGSSSTACVRTTSLCSLLARLVVNPLTLEEHRAPHPSCPREGLQIVEFLFASLCAICLK